MLFSSFKTILQQINVQNNQPKYWVTGLKHTTSNRQYSGCGSVFRAVTSDSRGPKFKSSNRQNLCCTFTVNWIKNTKLKEKRLWLANFLKQVTNGRRPSILCNHALTKMFYWFHFRMILIANLTPCAQEEPFDAMNVLEANPVYKVCLFTFYVESMTNKSIWN